MNDDKSVIYGFIFHLNKYNNLIKVKNETVKLCQTLKSDTEDKVYIYDKDRLYLDKYLSESIGYCSNWMQPKHNDTLYIKKALQETLDVITKSNKENKQIIFITDHKDKNDDYVLNKFSKNVEKYEVQLKIISLVDHPINLISEINANSST